MDGRQSEKSSATPPKPSHPDDVAVKPEHPGNIPAGTPGNPVEWGEPYEVGEDAKVTEKTGNADKRRRPNPDRQGDQTKP
jgi:hypothetical protein